MRGQHWRLGEVDVCCERTEERHGQAGRQEALEDTFRGKPGHLQAAWERVPAPWEPADRGELRLTPLPSVLSTASCPSFNPDSLSHISLKGSSHVALRPSPVPNLWQTPVRLLCAPASAAGGTREATGLPSSGGFLKDSSAGQQEEL